MLAGALGRQKQDRSLGAYKAGCGGRQNAVRVPMGVLGVSRGPSAGTSPPRQGPGTPCLTRRERAWAGPGYLGFDEGGQGPPAQLR